MSEQTIQIQATRIKSVQLKPECDILVVQEGRSASIAYQVGKLIPGSPAVAGVVGRGKILDDKGNTVSPAIEGSPAIPAVPDSMEVVDSGVVDMDENEWKSWLSQDDNDYRTSIVAKRLGWTLDGPFKPVA